MVWCSLGTASKDQMVIYDQETNAISATSSYSHDILDRSAAHKNIGEINSIADSIQTKQKQQY